MGSEDGACDGEADGSTDGAYDGKVDGASEGRGTKDITSPVNVTIYRLRSAPIIGVDTTPLTV